MQNFLNDNKFITSYISIGVGLILIIIALYTYQITVSNADTTKAIGSLAVTLSPNPSQGNTEYVELNYSGFGKFDITDLVLMNGKDVVYTFKSIQIPPDGYIRVCASASNNFECNLEWSGGAVWDNASGTLELLDSNGGTIIYINYESPSLDDIFRATTDINRVVYEANDSIKICHSSNGNKYSMPRSNIKNIIEGKAGHATHTEFDVIPPFFYIIENRIGFYDGMNWFTRRVLYESGCRR